MHYFFRLTALMFFGFINATTTQDSHSKYESCAAQLYPKLVDKKPISSGLIQTPGSKLES
jgi:hypothetical protein